MRTEEEGAGPLEAVPETGSPDGFRRAMENIAREFGRHLADLDHEAAMVQVAELDGGRPGLGLGRIASNRRRPSIRTRS